MWNDADIEMAQATQLANSGGEPGRKRAVSVY